MTLVTVVVVVVVFFKYNSLLKQIDINTAN